MKLASLKYGRDGKLVIVSSDLTKATHATDIATHFQYALDHWEICFPLLEKRAEELENGTAESFPFDPEKCASPLPRAYQWLDGSTFINHIRLARQARGSELPEDVLTNPLMYQGGSDSFLGPREDITFPTEDYGIDFEAEIAVITGDVPMGVSVEDASHYIRFVMLVNDISLRYIAQEELKKGFGFIQAKPSSAFSPLAVTPEELGDAWKDFRVHLPITAHWNGEQFGHPHAGADMQFNFAQLIAHAAKTRPLCAGTIIGSGTVSNEDPAAGHVCIVEKRMVETIENGKAKTWFMKFGDTIRIDMVDEQGASIFGAIEQTVRKS